MCGRITLTRPNLESIASELDVDSHGMRGYPIYAPRYNVAPTQVHPILVMHKFEESRSRTISPMRWGIIDAARKLQTINARAESLESRPAWREAFETSRCAVITDGFYEWTGPKTARRPLWFHRADFGLVMLAGLWQWHESGDGFQQTFAIITTAANALMAPIHDRMPAILTPGNLDEWLDDRSPDAARLKAMLAPAPADALVAQPVSTRVNNVANDGPDLLEPPTDPANEKGATRSLFGDKT